MLDDIYNKYISGYQFVDQSTYIEFLKNNESSTSHFTAPQMRRLGNFVGLCCKTGTFKAQDFVKNHTTNWFRSPDFVNGIVQKCLKSSDQKNIVFGAWEYGLIALRQLGIIDKSQMEMTLNDIGSTPIDTLNIRYSYRKDELKAKIGTIFYSPDTQAIKQRLSDLLA